MTFANSRIIRMFVAVSIIISCLVEVGSLQTVSEDALIFKIINSTTALSKQRHFHIIDMQTTHSITPVIKMSHQHFISVTFMNHPGYLQRNMDNRNVKNILFFLRDYNDILSFIFYSINHGLQSSWKWQNYCFQRTFEPGSLGTSRTKCDRTISITDKDLESDSKLPDSIFNQTRRLYGHEIWNSVNYLVFFIPDAKNPHLKTPLTSVPAQARPGSVMRFVNETQICDLDFTFRFMWRFFRGLRAVICINRLCYRYDPFKMKILKFGGRMTESYFDFEWNSMNRKALFLLHAQNNEEHFDQSFGTSPFATIILYPFFELEKKLDYSLKFNEIHSVSIGHIFDAGDYEQGQKYGIDVYLIGGGVGVSNSNVHRFNNLLIDSGSLCFMLPRSDFMPQYLTVFKSFEVTVWICIVTTGLVFIIIRKFYDHMQLNLFKRLYTERELEAYEGTSVLLAVYSYFLCVSQTRLFLGKLISGKILFVIFSFSTIILATVFQGRMVNIINKKLRYAEVDSLAEMEDSDVLIQSSNVLEDKNLFIRNLSLPWMDQRIVDNFKFEHDFLTEIYSDADNETDYIIIAKDSSVNESVHSWNFSDAAFEEGLRNIDSIMKTDGFVKNIPPGQMAYETFQLKNPISEQRFEYHKVEECLMRFPYDFYVLKYSFFWDKLKDTVSRLTEAGYFGYSFKVYETNEVYEINPIKEKDGQEFRPYNMSDLRVGFGCLYLGLLISGFAFILELFKSLVK